ncbi:unnamed protein product [Rangifer tarandus platyrhynchus]|uniref:Uncharacterized protein n=1 Tax=Rangifer tarandus platyrhynchus TaxID=3082113 RepID=A0ABN8YEF6_RANTA|nr:unnamed protein product [Rangifer tarandus platyrhynchus]
MRTAGLSLSPDSSGYRAPQPSLSPQLPAPLCMGSFAEAGDPLPPVEQAEMWRLAVPREQTQQDPSNRTPWVETLHQHQGLPGGLIPFAHSGVFHSGRQVRRRKLPQHQGLPRRTAAELGVRGGVGWAVCCQCSQTPSGSLPAAPLPHQKGCPETWTPCFLLPDPRRRSSTRQHLPPVRPGFPLSPPRAAPAVRRSSLLNGTTDSVPAFGLWV